MRFNEYNKKIDSNLVRCIYKKTLTQTAIEVDTNNLPSSLQKCKKYIFWGWMLPRAIIYDGNFIKSFEFSFKYLLLWLKLNQLHTLRRPKIIFWLYW